MRFGEREFRLNVELSCREGWLNNWNNSPGRVGLGFSGARMDACQDWRGYAADGARGRTRTGKPFGGRF